MTDVTASLTVKDSFPQGRDYVFVCDTTGLNAPVTYDWNFGDGTKLYDLEAGEVFHTFAHGGSYHVTCVANNGDYDVAAWVEVEVEGDPAAALVIKEWYPQHADYVLECQTEYFDGPVSYDWDFGDGMKLYDLQGADVYHTFVDPGEYHVTCVANDGEHNVAAWTEISVSQAQTTPALMLYHVGTMDDGEHFRCEDRGFYATYYDWDFGDNTSITTTVPDVAHMYYGDAEHYVVTCVGRDGELSASDFIVV
jgi:PKD repeat protein